MDFTQTNDAPAVIAVGFSQTNAAAVSAASTAAPTSSSPDDVMPDYAMDEDIPEAMAAIESTSVAAVEIVTTVQSGTGSVPVAIASTLAAGTAAAPAAVGLPVAQNVDPEAMPAGYAQSGAAPAVRTPVIGAGISTPPSPVDCVLPIASLATRPAAFSPAFSAWEGVGSLQSLLTAGTAIGTVLQGVVDGTLVSVQLVAGISAHSPEAGIVRPADYDATNNSKIWTRIA